MNLIALAVCFLFVFCPPHKRAKVRSHAPTAQEQNDKTGSDARGKSCDQITKGYDIKDNSDAFVSGFPADQQRRVLICIDRLTKRGTK